METSSLLIKIRVSMIKVSTKASEHCYTIAFLLSLYLLCGSSFILFLWLPPKDQVQVCT